MRTIAAARLYCAVRIGGPLVLLTAFAAAADAQNTRPTVVDPRVVLTLDAAGRTLTASSAIKAGVDLSIKIAPPAGDIRLCGSTPIKVTRGKRTLRILGLPDVTPPRELKENEGEDIDEVGGAFRIAAKHTGAFVMFNLFEAAATQNKELGECWDSVQEAKRKRTDLEKHISLQKGVIKDRETDIAVLRPRLESQRADAAIFDGSGDTAERIAAILKVAEETRTVLTAKESELVAAQLSLRDSEETLSKADATEADELGMKAADAEYLLASVIAGAQLKVGGIVTGKLKAAYYDFGTFSPRSTLQMTPMGDFPVVRYGERVFAVIANVLSASHPYAFFLTAVAQDGAVVNTEPVRPTFDIATGEAAGAKQPLPKQRVNARAYTDVILAVRGSFVPNQYPEVTISTERAADDDPKKRTTVTLVDKAKYPQFRALYRYNFNTGVFGSRLRTSNFTKVKIKDDDAATEDVDESRYRIDESRADASVKPLFAFTYYLKPVDIQAPVGHERFIPNPTLGFAFANPADNIYLGFSHEILRNAQLFWGWHWGFTKKLVPRNDVSEDRVSDAPQTRERRQRAFGIGATFNVDVIKRIFQ